MSIGRHLLGFILAAIAGGGAWLVCAAPAGAQAMPPAGTTPQQTAADGVPAAYPSTYPSTQPSAYPATSPPLYPSTADGTGGTVGLSGSGYGTAEQAGTGTPAIAGPPGGPQPLYGDPGPLYTPYGSPDAMTAARPLEPGSSVERWLVDDEPWTWQFLPTGLMYKSYLAGLREPRFGTQFGYERGQGWVWDSTLGARVGVIRYGTENDLWPEGWQLDVEGAAFPRLSLPERELTSVDFRAGMQLTRRVGPWEMKFGYYHYCSHLGDEYVLTHPEVTRINYVRESLIFGLAAYLNPDLRLYSEVGWAFVVEGETQPWEFQFGADWSSPEPTGPGGAPFFAINGHLRQENDFGGNMTVRTGWQWRGATGHLFRIGMQYFNGMSEQGQFFNTFEQQIGAGLWYDF